MSKERPRDPNEATARGPKNHLWYDIHECKYALIDRVDLRESSYHLQYLDGNTTTVPFFGMASAYRLRPEEKLDSDIVEALQSPGTILVEEDRDIAFIGDQCGLEQISPLFKKEKAFPSCLEEVPGYDPDLNPIDLH